MNMSLSPRHEIYHRYNNSEEGKQIRKDYYIKNKDKIKARIKKYGKEHYLKNKDKKKQYSDAHKSQIRNNQLKRLYGITLDQHRQMFISQNGRCAICDKVFDNSSDIHTDHNHKTGQVRQLLCLDCNHMIGQSKENIQILLKGAEYLNKWNNI